jgi:hypothetical protein
MPKSWKSLPNFRDHLGLLHVSKQTRIYPAYRHVIAYLHPAGIPAKSSEHLALGYYPYYGRRVVGTLSQIAFLAGHDMLLLHRDRIAQVAGNRLDYGNHGGRVSVALDGGGGSNRERW